MKCTTLFIVFIMLCGAGFAQAQKPLFTLMNSKATGVHFENVIREDDSLHVFRYEYLYNGHGIGIGDFDSDGWMDLFVSGNTVPNKLFLNTQNFTFKDVTAAAGVKGAGTWSTGVSIADINGDGLTDIYVCHSGKYSEAKLANELFINKGIKNGVPSFEEEAKKWGLDAPGTQSTQAAFFDYDRDGDLDMFLVNHSNHTYNPYLNTRKLRSTPHWGFGNRLFRNDGNKFNDVTIESGIINNALNFGLSVTVSDLNSDGWPDFYTTSDYTEQDCYYVNNRNGTFTQSLQQSFTHISKFSMGADIGDINNDARPDVITLDMLPEDNYRQKLLKGPDEYDAYHLLLDSGYYHQQMRNMLHLNRGLDGQGEARFSEIGQLSGISNTDWSWAALLGDWDNDGWKDLMITNGYLRDFTDLDFLKYTVADEQLAQAAKGNLNFKTYDLVQKMPSNKLTNYLFKNNGDLTFANKSGEWGFDKPTVSNAAAYADFDNDGDLDLVIGNNNEPLMLYRNESSGANFLQVALHGTEKNSGAIGSKVWLYASGKKQFAEAYPVRGYQSSVSPVLHFGLGQVKAVDSLVVQWPDGKSSVYKNIVANQIFTAMQEGSAVLVNDNKHQLTKFEDITTTSGLQFHHRENDFIDFKDEVLLPYQLSRMGPALAKGDVNGDGLEDVFVGGAIEQSGKLFLQQPSGVFVEGKNDFLEADAVSEDVRALFFDADRDGDLDLYVVSGGNEYGEGSPEYQDRLYINVSAGIFVKAANALPQMLHSKSTVAAGDMDGDGDTDLFVGGACVAGAFPQATRSYLLRNDSHTDKVVFTDVTATVAPELVQPGMTSAAIWQDLNGDDFPELMVGGEWMPLMLLSNDGKTLKNISDKAGLAQTSGLWSALYATDIEGDGDIDFIAGNSGLNNQFKASPKEPMTLQVADFDDNGTLDPMMCYYVQGKSYPMVSRDELLDAIVPLRKKFVKYRDYAGADMATIFTKQQMAKISVLQCTQLASCILTNDGTNHFTITPLPAAAQFSKIFSVCKIGADKSGKNDLLLAGNFYPYRVQLGRNDAGLGVWLQNKKGSGFDVADNSTAGLFIDGDVRQMVDVKTSEGNILLIIAKNDAPVQVIRIKP